MLRKISVILIILGIYLLILQNPKVYAQAGGKVDIAKYAKQIERNEKSITLQWEEPRNIFEVVVKSSKPVQLSNAKLQYWQYYWPQKPLPEGEVEGGSSGWLPQDDWFNGHWKDADTKMKIGAIMVFIIFIL